MSGLYWSCRRKMRKNIVEGRNKNYYDMAFQVYLAIYYEGRHLDDYEQNLLEEEYDYYIESIMFKHQLEYVVMDNKGRRYKDIFLLPKDELIYYRYGYRWASTRNMLMTSDWHSNRGGNRSFEDRFVRNSLLSLPYASPERDTEITDMSLVSFYDQPRALGPDEVWPEGENPFRFSSKCADCDGTGYVAELSQGSGNMTLMPCGKCGASGFVAFSRTMVNKSTGKESHEKGSKVYFRDFFSPGLDVPAGKRRGLRLAEA